MAATPEPSPPTPSAPVDRLEAVLAELLERAPELDATAVDACCAAHPELAAHLRAQVAFLRRTRGAAAPALGTPPAASDAGHGDRIGGFRLVRRIGGGGMGVVHLAVEEGLGREVALKLIRPDHLPFGDALRRFRREIEVVAGLRHPGIVPVLTCGEDGGVPFYAMELVSGRSLASVLTDAREDPASALTALAQAGARDRVDASFRIALQVAQALAHAHERGVVHRDVKPSNVMLDADGRARLIDFGLAHVAADEAMTRTGVQPGSLAYMSPEQVRGEPIDATTDVWSLGVTLYEMLSGRLPFAGGTEERLRAAILQSSPAPLHGAATRVPWDAANVVATAMAPERARRYRTMAAFAADLQAYLERRPIAARRAGALLRLRRWVQRRPARAAGIALAVAVLVVLPITLLWQEHQARLAIEQEAIRARAAERDARRDAATAQRIVAFLEAVFRQNRPEEDLGRELTVRELLDRSMASIRSDLQDEPDVRVALLDAMGGAYHGLGESRIAAELHEESLRVREDALGQRGDALHHTLAELAAARQAIEDYAGAEAMLRRVMVGLPPLDAPGGARAVGTALALAAALTASHRFDEAQQLLDGAVAACRRELEPDALLLGEALARRARLTERSAGSGAAVADQDAALAILRRRLPANHPRLLRLLIDVATREPTGHATPREEALLVEAEAAAAKVYAADHPRLAEVRQDLAMLRGSQGRHDEARELIAASEAALRRSQAPPTLAFARHLTHAAAVARYANDLDAAVATARAAVRMFAELVPSGSVNECIALDQVVGVRLGQQRGADAVAEARRLLDLRPRVDPVADLPRLGSAVNVVRVGAAAKDRELAEQGAAAALRLLPAGNDERMTDVVFRWFGTWLMGQRRHDDAERVLRQHLAAFAGSRLEGSDGHAFALLDLGTVLHVTKRSADALELLQEAHAIVERLPESELRARVPEWVGFLLEQLGRVDEAQPYVEKAVAAARAKNSTAEIQSATVSLAQIRKKLGDPAGAEALLWPVLDELAAAGGTNPPQAVRVVDLLIDLQQQAAVPAARAAAFERLRAAAQRLLPPGHKALKKLEQRAAGG